MRKLSLTFFSVAVLTFSITAQTKIKDGTVSGGSLIPNPDAILELESSNKGLLFPRVELDSTGLPSPLSNHVRGMTVYNTKKTADVLPGIYYNDGNAWKSLLTTKSTQSAVDTTVILNVGESFIYYKKNVPFTTSKRLLQDHFSDVPVLEGLKLEAYYSDASFYMPRWYNVSGTTKKYTFTCISTVTSNYDEANQTLNNGDFKNVDGDAIVYCSPTHSETVTADLIINDKWYRILWYVFIDRSVNTSNTSITVRISITRLH